MQKLRSYLESENISTSEFAKRIGRNSTTVWRIIQGRVKPNDATKAAIALATNGAVQPRDFYPDIGGQVQ